MTFTAMEKSEAQYHLNQITSPHLYQGPPSLSLFDYLDVTQHITRAKRIKLFTHNLSAYPHPSIPNLYITNLGFKILNLVSDNVYNPYLQGQFQNTLIHPEIAQLSALMMKYGLNSYHTYDYQRLEHACELCFADFKVQTKTRAFTTQLKSWNSRYDSCHRTYKQFMEFIYQESNKFEIHSVLVQRMRPNGQDALFGDNGFRDMATLDIVKEKCDEIIQNVWRNRKRNNVFGILSREETDINQTCSMRLMFFVKKEYSDLVCFKSTPLFEMLEPYFTELNLDRVALGNIGTINAGIAPLFQGQEQNYYDLDQILVGNRLKTLKAQLLIPNYLFRIGDDVCKLTVERGRSQYYR